MGLKIKVSPLFIVFSFLVVFFDYFSLYCTYITILLIHEFAHYFMAKSKGYVSQSICIMPYGLVMHDQNIYNKKDEILISFAGPISNILLALMCIALWWCVPQSYYYTYDFMFANMVLGLYNLIPIYPLDGGRIMLALCPLNKRKNVRKYMKFFAVIFAVLFGVLFVISLFDKINTSYLFISFFLISTIIDKNEYSFSLFKDKNRPLEVKTFVIRKHEKFHNVLKLMKGDYYYQFLILDDNGRIVKKLTQDEMIEFYSKK